MSPAIILLPTDAVADAADVEAIRAAGILVLRVSDPESVKVLDLNAVIGTQPVVRAMLDMMASMKAGEDHPYNREHHTRFTNALVKYLNETFAERAP